MQSLDMSVQIAELISGEPPWANKSPQRSIAQRRLTFYVDTNSTFRDNISPGYDPLAQRAPIDSYRINFYKDTITRVLGRIGISAVEVENPADANIIVAEDAQVDYAAGRCYMKYPDQNSGKYQAFVLLNHKRRYADFGGLFDRIDTWSPDRNEWRRTFVHELGHGLGLEHPFESLDGDATPGFTYETESDYIMGYRTPDNTIDFTSLEYAALQQVWSSIRESTNQPVASTVSDVGSGESPDALIGGIGPRQLTGTAKADLIMFTEALDFGKGNSDTITDFRPNEGDRIVIGADIFAGVDNISIKYANSQKRLKKLAESKSLFVYDQRKGIFFFNEDRSKSGWGEGGAFAILLGEPSISLESIQIA